MTWRDQVTRFFYDTLPSSYQLPVMMDSFKLAVSVFRCQRGEESGSEVLGFYYPELGIHTPGRPSNPTDYFSTSLFWPSEYWWKFDEVSSQVIHQILIACQMDPSTTTVDELNDLNPQVVCETCSPTIFDVECLMTWKRALLHWNQTHKHAEASTSTWRLFLPVAPYPLITRLHDWEKTLETMSIWRCRLCPWYKEQQSQNMQDILWHVSFWHDIPNPDKKQVLRDPSGLLDDLEPLAIESFLKFY